MSGKDVGIKEYFGFIENVAPFLDEKLYLDAKEVDYGQWELPFETVLLALMKKSFDEVIIDMDLTRELAHEADIIESGVIDPNTWKRFKKWSGQLQ